MKRKFALLFTFSLFAIVSFSQKNVADTLKHKIHTSALYGSLGFGPIYGNVIGNYEIMLVERPDKVFKTRGLRVGFGAWELWEDFGWTSLVSYTCFTGAGNRHLELGIGATYMEFLSTNGFFVFPATNIGYRYQKPGGRLIFRTGLGFPEILYASLGYRFI